MIPDNKPEGKSGSDIFELFLRKKPVMMMVKLMSQTEMYASVLAKQVDCTYSHTVRVLQELKKMKLVNFEERGRIKIISLTKRGKEIAETFERLVKLLEKD